MKTSKATTAAVASIKPAGKAPKATVAKSAPQAPATVTTLVPKSKIDMASGIFDKMHAADYVPTEGSSPRKDFILACVNELGMTEKGASTYWQNLRNKADGHGLYKNAKPGTGEPRGRKVDVQGRLKKAAAKVEALQSKVAKDMEALKAAQSELVEMAVGEQATPAG